MAEMFGVKVSVEGAYVVDSGTSDTVEIKVPIKPQLDVEIK